MHLALGVDHAGLFQVVPDRFRLANAHGAVRPDGSVTGIDGELVLLDDAEADSRVLLDFLLKVFGELLVALGRDHGQRVHVEAAQPLALLVHTEPQAAADGLPALALGAHLAQAQIWKTFGLSQPSRSAEWEKMNFSLVSKLSSFSLSFMIRL